MIVETKIVLNSKTRQVYKSKNKIGIAGENNVERLIFTFEDNFVDGTASLLTNIKDSDDNYLYKSLIKDGESYYCDVTSELLQAITSINLQVMISNSEGELIFKSDIFEMNIGDTLDAGDEATDYSSYQSWLAQANSKIDEIDNSITSSNKATSNSVEQTKKMTELIEDVETKLANGDFVGEKGDKGDKGDTGEQGIAGNDALINGVNTLNIVAGDNIQLEQTDSTLKISNTYAYDDTDIKESISSNTTQIASNKDDISTLKENEKNYSLITETGSKIDLSIDSSTYVMTLSLKDKNDNELSSGNIDLPLEAMVVNASYDSENKKIVLTLQSGSQVSFSVADLVSGLVSEEDLTTALADYVKTDVLNTTLANYPTTDDLDTTLADYEKTSDLTTTLGDYVKFTDYATSSKAGVFKTSSGVELSSGAIQCTNYAYSSYSSLSNNTFISKGTLENTITGKGLTTKTYVDETLGDIDEVLDQINGAGIEDIESDSALFTDNAYQHNNVFRGKDITSKWDDGTVSASVADGTFKDVYVGDYFTKSITINGTSYTCKFIVADLDTYYGYSNYAMVSTHHLAVIVTRLPDAQMNTSNTTNGGYAGSAMHTTTLPTYLSAISDVLDSSHIVSHQKLYSTSVNSTGYNRFGSNSGCSNSWAWSTNQSISLLTESQVYGHTVWSSSGYDTGEAYKQLSLFRMKSPNNVVGNKWVWLRDIANSSDFARLCGGGDAVNCSASSFNSVVPILLLK